MTLTNILMLNPEMREEYLKRVTEVVPADELLEVLGLSTEDIVYHFSELTLSKSKQIIESWDIGFREDENYDGDY